MFFKTLLFLTYLILFISCQNPENTSLYLPKKVISKIYPGIVEIIIPKIEDKDIIYERDLPFKRQDFHIRNDKYHSIGTGFFIDNKRLLSAAHVFSLEEIGLNSKFYIRDHNNEIHKIKLVTRYSQYRDIIEFELETYPKKFNILQLQEKTEIGDMVYAVGNALGEGISTRGGQISSYTPEHYNGKWKFLRFSSPASPGNSGGPLVNTKGEVVGLVVMKNNSENLNFALPINELKNTKTDMARFFLRNQRVQDGLVVTTSDFFELVSLPKEIDKLHQEAILKKDIFFKKLIKTFKSSNSSKLFPQHHRFRNYLKNQALPLYSGNIDKNTNLYDWKLIEPTFSKISLENGQTIHQAKGNLFQHILMIEKPKDQSILSFYQNYVEIMKTTIKILGANRPMAGERIPIVSYGKPEITKKWRDKLGRHWTSLIYQIKYNNSFLAIHLTPGPKGVFAFVEVDWFSKMNEGYFTFVEENILEIPTSYGGTIDQWTSFLKSSFPHSPNFLKDLEINIKNGIASLSSSDFKIQFTQMKIKEDDAYLFLRIGYDPEKRLALKPISWMFKKNKLKKEGINISLHFSPTKDSSEVHIHDWEQLINKAGPYTGNVQNSNGLFRITKKLMAPKVSYDPVLAKYDLGEKLGQKFQKLYLITCFDDKLISKIKLKKGCSTTSKTFSIDK